MRLTLFVFLAAQLAAQVTASRISTMRYNDRAGAKMHGDTYRCAMKSGAVYYCIYADGEAPPAGLASRNLGFMSLSLDLANVNNTSLTLIDSTSGYGSISSANNAGWTNGTSFKSGGLDFHNSGKLYWQIQQLCLGAGSGGCSGANITLNSTIIVSDDATTVSPNHWANPKTYLAAGNTVPHNGTTATGDPPQGPTADSAIMWPGSTHMQDMLPVQYVATDTTDDNHNTCYWLSDNQNFQAIYLSKVACASMMDVTAWRYYTGPIGGDPAVGGNWCGTSYAACESAHTVLGSAACDGAFGCVAGMVHLGAPWSTYLTISSQSDGGAAGSNLRNRIQRSSSLTGPFTSIATDAKLNNQAFPQLLLDTLTAGTSGTITAISGGSFDNGDWANYSPYWSTYQLGGVTAIISSSGKMTLQGRVNIQ